MSKTRDFIESSSVGLVLLFVLLPVRVLFVRYISDDWFGSFGIILGISILLIYLAKKNKLGWFGRAFHRQMFKAHRGKRKYFYYSWLIVGFLFFAGTVHAINISETTYKDAKQELLDSEPFKGIQTLDDLAEKSSGEFDLEKIPLAFGLFFYILIFRFDVYAVIFGALNDISDGYMLHFSTVFLVEQIELIGIAFYTKFTIKKEEL